MISHFHKHSDVKLFFAHDLSFKQADMNGSYIK